MSETISVIAVESKNLDTTCYRGSAPLSDLTHISTADVFDQVTNPDGLQRDLSKKHAAEAYSYVARPKDSTRPRAYPEVVLNVRDRKVLKKEVLHEDEHVKTVRLTFDIEAIDRARSVKVSRVDGNHRLFFGAGDGKDREPIDLHVPFQVHVGLSPDQEASIFTDINHEQKGMNTSHLAFLLSRMTPEEVELVDHPERAFARRLTEDVASPWAGRVHLGGSKEGSKGEYRPINFVALENGVRRILRKSQYLRSTFDTPDAQYGIIRNYWQAVSAVYPEAFERPRDYLIAKNIGVNTFSELGALVIDRCLAAGNVEIDHMVPFLLDAKEAIDWHRNSPQVAGMSGNRAVLALSGAMAKKIGNTKAERMADPVKVEAEQREKYLPAPEPEDEGEQPELEAATA